MSTHVSMYKIVVDKEDPADPLGFDRMPLSESELEQFSQIMSFRHHDPDLLWAMLRYISSDNDYSWGVRPVSEEGCE